VLRAFLTECKTIWQVVNGPGNDPIIISLIVGLGLSIASHLAGFLSYRARLKDKDERIADLVDQRNKFQEIVLKGQGIERKSSKERQ
jgi:hypothetical protein